MSLNDIEDEFKEKGAQGLDIGLLKLFLLLYANDIIIFSESSEGCRQDLISYMTVAIGGS